MGGRRGSGREGGGAAAEVAAAEPGADTAGQVGQSAADRGRWCLLLTLHCLHGVLGSTFTKYMSG